MQILNVMRSTTLQPLIAFEEEHLCPQALQMCTVYGHLCIINPFHALLAVCLW